MAVELSTPKPERAALDGAPENAAPARMFPLGAPHEGWFSALNASSRNCTVWFSVLGTWNCLCTAISIDWQCGVVTKCRLTLPKVPAGAMTNEAGSYHRAGVRFAAYPLPTPE